MRKFIALLRSFNIEELVATNKPLDRLDDVNSFCRELMAFMEENNSEQASIAKIADELEAEIAITPADMSALFKLQIIITALQKHSKAQRAADLSLKSALISLRQVLVERIREYYEKDKGLLSAYLDLLAQIRCKVDGTRELQNSVDDAIRIIRAWLAKNPDERVVVSDREVGDLTAVFGEIFQEYACAESFFLSFILHGSTSQLKHQLTAEIDEIDDREQMLAQLLAQEKIDTIADTIRSWRLPLWQQNIFYNQLHAYVSAHYKEIKEAEINRGMSEKEFAQTVFNLYSRDLGIIYGCLELLKRSRAFAHPGLYEWMDLSIAKLEAWKSKAHLPVQQRDVQMLIDTLDMLAKFSNNDPYSFIACNAMKAHSIDIITDEFTKDASRDITAEFTELLNAHRIMDIPAVIATRFAERDYARQDFVRQFCKFKVENAFQIYHQHSQSDLYREAVTAKVPNDATKTDEQLQTERQNYTKQLICQEFIESMLQYIQTTPWQLGMLGGVKLQGLDTYAPKNVAAIYKICLEAEKDGNWVKHFNEMVLVGAKASSTWRLNIFGLNTRSAEAQDLYDRCKNFHTNGKAYERELAKEQATKRQRLA